MGQVGRAQDHADPAARAIAFYLPQYHPIPENDEWWGPGFTEWTNVAKARRLYPGHRQPDLPADLGFYDLRVPETRQAQADLARRYGIAAFCYWHYWFGNGRRLLERPITEVIERGEPDFPFCLGWANQTWSGIWHDAADRVLMEQSYPGAEDEQAHFDAILPAFRDERYFRVAGKPVFYVFRPEELPDVRGWIERWQAMAMRAGLGGLYLVAEVSTLRGDLYTSAVADGFDVGAYLGLPARRRESDRFRMRVWRKAVGGPEVWPYSPQPVQLPQQLDPADYQPVVYPNWDNTPRSRRRGLVLHGADPEKFRPHVAAAVRALADRPSDERLLWVKSWNEWAEGNHLEPDQRFGHGWLQVLYEELARAR